MENKNGDLAVTNTVWMYGFCLIFLNRNQPCYLELRHLNKYAFNQPVSPSRQIPLQTFCTASVQSFVVIKILMVFF